MSGASSSEAEVWTKLDAAKTPRSGSSRQGESEVPGRDLGLLQAATEFFSQALADLPNNRDVAVSTAKKALDLFEQVSREAPHDSPRPGWRRGKARVLEMRNDLPQAIEQYQLVAKEWPGTPEAEEANATRRGAQGSPGRQLSTRSSTPTRRPRSPCRRSARETLPPPACRPPSHRRTTSPARPRLPTSPLSTSRRRSLRPRAIPGLREVIESRASTPAQPAQPKAGTPAPRPPRKPPSRRRSAATLRPKGGDSSPSQTLSEHRDRRRSCWPGLPTPPESEPEGSHAAMWPPPLSETPQEFEVKPRTDGKRLDAYLASRFTDYSRRVIQKSIDAEAVLVNGRPVKASYSVRPGDVISIRLPDLPDMTPKPEDIPIEVVYEDEA